MAYNQFALIYDQFMYDQPYEKWLNVVQPYLKDNVLDIATGTGSFLELIPRDIQVTGVDLSEDMLTIAQTKRNDATLVAQDMTQLALNKKFQTITCLCDSLNYLQEPHDVSATFSRVHQHLEDEGFFIFDVHSTKKFEAYFNNDTYSDEIDDMLYVWHAIQGDAIYSVFHELTFFIKTNNVYHRFDEEHYQRTYPIATYKQLLKDSGFEVVRVFADFDSEWIVDDSTEAFFERVFFIAKKS
ncbi:class I SAM-dependent DNA methyltransferase [Macrococcoides caseolyticum]|uniref:class I SAM-dependent DNA methyltransferase n=1 Tax=Macrococcoides caseolyticum TaxID=69966 RepID=UPI001F2C54FB|nr:class I SAM-dependent methyltransferase [Macrococcus caseolyticus]MCE4956170.1 class I SAM-dependent methyltransferase [Macrococcus caseolyticus]